MHYRPDDKIGFVILQNGEPKNGKFEQALAQRLMKYAEGR